MLDVSRFLMKAAVFAWGLPLLIVTITASVTHFGGYDPLYRDAAQRDVLVLRARMSVLLLPFCVLNDIDPVVS